MPLLLSLLLAGLATGIWGSYRSSFPAPGLYRIDAIFQGRAGDTLILVKHAVVPGLMEEMGSMAFFSESRELLDAADLRPGDPIRLTVRRLPDRLLVVGIKRTCARRQGRLRSFLAASSTAGGFGVSLKSERRV